MVCLCQEEFIKRLSQAGQLQAAREKRTTVQQRDVGPCYIILDLQVFLTAFQSDRRAESRRVCISGRLVVINALPNWLLIFLYSLEIVSASVFAPPPPPAQRKSKASTAPTKEAASMNIKEALGKGKTKPSTASDDDGNVSETAEHPDPRQNSTQEEGGDSMEVI
jgi:hypothetical protein